MSAREAAPRRSKLGSAVKEVLLVLLGALLISALLRAFVFEPFTIPSESMENTLQVNDKVVAQKITHFNRGDVIVFRDPGNWVRAMAAPRTTNPVQQGLEFVGILPNSSQDFLTKRIIGLPGDRVACCDAGGRVTVNGYSLDESGYLYSDGAGQVQPSQQPFDVVVPRNHLFVLGDHRNASGDSRCHMAPGSEMVGFVPIDYVVGPVGLIVAPLQRWQQLKTPVAFEGVPPPAADAPATPGILLRPEC